MAPTESTYVWNELLQDINSRGVQEVLLFITDGLKGMKDTIHQRFCCKVFQKIYFSVKLRKKTERTE
ncbi:transposase [Enterococcus faecium]|uniref:transposase n=1 Tax=Enterococcus faecium TaxID=1352 RepID=UPI0032B53A4F